MSWTHWLADKHALLVHLPVAAAVMIPIPILAAQRGGRGIRPWWTTCRYLAGAGLVGALLALLSGWCLAHSQGLPINPVSAAGRAADQAYRVHLLSGLLAPVLGLACLRSLYRNRQEHQGIGLVALFLGLVWCGAAFLSAYTGAPRRVPAPPPQVATPPPAPADPEAQAPLRALERRGFKALHSEPVRSAQHGNHWIRVWADPAAAEAYRADQPLPAGALLVMTTVDDRWGRPGYDSGPLYALEGAAPGERPKATFYWPSVPESRRGETGGESRAYWRDGDPRLQACQACHARGTAPARDRSRVTVPRKPKAEEA